ncbi:MAG TPA: hypothetical protein VMJ35_10055 [Dongiaceae bacterium]|nr:hypothetical protein [Dongiaceae bacterium]
MKIGMGLMALGVGVWSAWMGWTRTRKMDPIDLPVEAASGQSVAQSFRLNYDGLYLVEVVTDKAGATERLRSLEADWSVWSGGRKVSQGDTGEPHSAPAQRAESLKVLGEFNGRAGQSYELRVRFTKDVKELEAVRPRLKVAVSGLAKENLDAASVLLFSIVFICELFGSILLGIGIWGKAQSHSPVGRS